MIIIPPISFIPKRKRKGASAPPALTLVSAIYQASAPKAIVLTFDRPIDIAALNGNLIHVDDGPAEKLYRAGGLVKLETPTTLQIRLILVGTSPQLDVTLSADAENGIVAVGDGSPWMGCEGVALPYP